MISFFGGIICFILFIVTVIKAYKIELYNRQSRVLICKNGYYYQFKTGNRKEYHTYVNGLDSKRYEIIYTDIDPLIPLYLVIYRDTKKQSND